MGQDKVERYPQIVVFDLDYTLWPLWCDTHISRPIKAKDKYTIVDSYNQEFSFYKDVGKILKELYEADVKICTASRTCDPKMAVKMLKLLHVNDINGKTIPAIELITHSEWGTGSKIKHLRNIKKKYEYEGADFSEMCLFDDELRNRDVQDELGVKFIHIPNESVGLNYKIFTNGLHNWHLYNSGK